MRLLSAPAASTMLVAGVLAAAAALLAAGASPTARAADAPPAAPATKPALTVTATQPQTAALPLQLAANGSLHAWQEASVGAESNGMRLAEVRVNVGDSVRRGQVLATFGAEMARAELAQVQAAVAEAEAAAAEAVANAQRARDLQGSGAYSAQQVTQYLTAERTAQARVQAQRAALQVATLRLAQTQVLAPDHGVISARNATVGAVVPAGQELFRLIRQGRLEWRAEVPAADIGALKAGQAARVTPAGGSAVAGRVRVVAPTVDAATRNGLVYVDLPVAAGLKAGMFARGEFELGSGSGLTLPQSAVLLRDGFSYVFTVEPDNKVRQQKVTVGRRVGDRIELLGGLPANARIVASGGAFLVDGDTVRVVAAPK